MDQTLTFFETQSLALAATLISLSISFDSINKDSQGKATFIFQRTFNLDLLLEKFWKKELLIEPNTFFEAQRFLKSRIYGG